jgi:hypothetical protein
MYIDFSLRREFKKSKREQTQVKKKPATSAGFPE